MGPDQTLLIEEVHQKQRNMVSTKEVQIYELMAKCPEAGFQHLAELVGRPVCDEEYEVGDGVPPELLDTVPAPQLNEGRPE